MKEVKIIYTNYRGETFLRTIIPKEIVFESNEFHKEEQWILVAFDIDKQAERRFAIKYIKSWN